jgi:hypothetical protein
MIPCEGQNGFRNSPLWVTFSPIERAREVFLK